MLGRRVLAGLIIALAVLASALAGTVRRDRAHPGDFFALFLLDLLAVLVGGVTAAGYLAARRDRARGLLGVGLYLLLVAAAFAVLFPRWLPTDNAILGAALLAGLLAAAGAGLALAGAALLGGRSAAIGGAGALLAFLGVTAGGLVGPLVRLHVPLLVIAVVSGGVALLAWRRRRHLARPLLLAVVGAAVTALVLAARGPGDWATASTSAKLYSFPIVLLALGVGLAILDAVPPGPPPGRPGGRHG